MPYVMTNSFQVASQKAEQFEAYCRQPYRHLQRVPGFIAFELLRGEVDNGTIRYVALSIWTSQVALEAWTQSEAFAQGHRSGRLPASMIQGPPRQESFEMVALAGPGHVG